MPTVHIKISGKVQGVFFRASGREVAEKLGLTGWIKNTEDGNVEALATGSEAQLGEFTEWCKAGPEKAIVTHVEITAQEEQLFSGFGVVRGF